MIYFVATPIGNLEDITLRAVRILQESQIIYCEDTRTSKKLLDHYDVHADLQSYHKFNEQERVYEILEKARQDISISVISDAGMPAISDPGNILIKALQDNGIEYTVLPGPSAFTTALVLSGFDSMEFQFLGFFPQKEGQKLKLVEKLKEDKITSIFYESPHRIIKTLEFLKDTIPTRKICLVREISKLFEDVVIFQAKDLDQVEITEKGEMVLIIDKDSSIDEVDDDFIKDEIQLRLDLGKSKKTAVKEIAKEFDINKNRVYELSLEV